MLITGGNLGLTPRMLLDLHRAEAAARAAALPSSPVPGVSPVPGPVSPFVAGLTAGMAPGVTAPAVAPPGGGDASSAEPERLGDPGTTGPVGKAPGAQALGAAISAAMRGEKVDPGFTGLSAMFGMTPAIGAGVAATNIANVFGLEGTTGTGYGSPHPSAADARANAEAQAAAAAANAVATAAVNSPSETGLNDPANPDAADPESGGDRWAEGGLITRRGLKGPNPPGPDEGYASIQSGEGVLTRKAMADIGPQLLSMLNRNSAARNALIRGMLMGRTGALR